jgi:hypothetical protein
MASQAGMILTGWIQKNACRVNKGLNYIIIEKYPVSGREKHYILTTQKSL